MLCAVRVMPRLAAVTNVARNAITIGVLLGLRRMIFFPSARGIPLGIRYGRGPEGEEVPSAQKITRYVQCCEAARLPRLKAS